MSTISKFTDDIKLCRAVEDVLIIQIQEDLSKVVKGLADDVTFGKVLNNAHGNKKHSFHMKWRVKFER